MSSQGESQMQKVKSQVDAALDGVTKKLLEVAPQLQEPLGMAEEQTKLPRKYLVGAGLTLALALVVAILFAMDLHSFVLSVFFWVLLSHRSFRAIDAPSGADAPSPQQVDELKHLLAYSLLSCLFVVVDPVISFIPGYFYFKYALLGVAYYADIMDNALVGFMKSKVIPMMKKIESGVKED
mmetsp:Transcript_12664/g.46782  ORF Transcript_12664/g.46782 Transcript_12664/m.46782 type:complete len:181 (-) Transcript_12664:309-851(-)